MSNKTQLSTNNTQLASLISTLQGKAAGGGASIDTCSVTVNLLDLGGISATCYENGQLNVISKRWYASDENNITFNNVVCGSCFTVSDVVTSSMPTYTVENAEEITTGSQAGIGGVTRYPTYAFKITAPAGGTATITIYDAD